MSILSHLSAAEIAEHLHGRRSGASYMARCPAHEDRTPSLSLTDRDNKALLYCHSGCTQEAVIRALQDRGLWPRREYLSRSEWIEQQRRIEEMRQRIRSARYWANAIEPLLIELLEAEPPDTYPPGCITEREALTHALLEVRAASKDGTLLAALYGDWLRRDPKLTAALVYAGQHSEQRWSRRIWRWLDGQRNPN
jgi:hypothetical protein